MIKTIWPDDKDVIHITNKPANLIEVECMCGFIFEVVHEDVDFDG